MVFLNFHPKKDICQNFTDILRGYYGLFTDYFIQKTPYPFLSKPNFLLRFYDALALRPNPIVRARAERFAA
jgi:hypothetical protein